MEGGEEEKNHMEFACEVCLFFQLSIHSSAAPSKTIHTNNLSARGPTTAKRAISAYGCYLKHSPKMSLRNSTRFCAFKRRSRNHSAGWALVGRPFACPIHWLVGRSYQRVDESQTKPREASCSLDCAIQGLTIHFISISDNGFSKILLSILRSFFLLESRMSRAIGRVTRRAVRRRTGRQTSRRAGGVS